MKITIIGAGIAGLTTAIALRKSGFETEIFEAAPKLEHAGSGLGLAANAFKALAVIGLADKIKSRGSKMYFFEIHNKSGKVLSKVSGGDFGENIAIHRADLHDALLEEIPSGTLHTGRKATGLEETGKGIRVRFEDGTTHDTDYLIIADGINSKLRDAVAPEAKVNYSGYTCWRGVTKNPGKEVKGAYEIWDPKGRFGYVPLPGNRIYWFACIPAPEGKQMAHFTLADLEDYFGGFGHTVRRLIESTPAGEVVYDDIRDMKPLRNYSYGNILLIGDAAHAATPNMGQGACQAIEDAVVLARTMAKRPSVSRSFSSFEKKRLARTHYIIKQSAKIGRIAHLQNPILVALRDMIMPMLPKSFQRSQMRKINRVTF